MASVEAAPAPLVLRMLAFSGGVEIPGFPTPQHVGRFGTAKRNGKW